MPSVRQDHRLHDFAAAGWETAALALPLAAGQLSQMLIALSDTLMVGRLGVLPLAAATFANNVLYLPFIFGLGFSLAVSIRVSSLSMVPSQISGLFEFPSNLQPFETVGETESTSERMRSKPNLFGVV